MATRTLITEGTLRRAMRDDRYWRHWHPERANFVSWVTTGFRDLADHGSGSGGTVFVKAYTRTVDGKAVHVAAHQRGAPPRSEGAVVADDIGDRRTAPPHAKEPNHTWEDDEPLATPIQGRRQGPPDSTGAPPDPGPPMERIPGRSGRENASDVPSWARGIPRGQNETPQQYADRLMSERWGDGWRGTDAREREHSQIQKHGSRAFRMPFRIPGGRGRE